MKTLYLNTDFIIDKINQKLNKPLSQKKIGQVYEINEQTLVKYKRKGMPNNLANFLIFLKDADLLKDTDIIISTEPYKSTDPTERKKELHKK